MKCPNCGYENRPEARFCKQCGKVLPQSPEERAGMPAVHTALPQPPEGQAETPAVHAALPQPPEERAGMPAAHAALPQSPEERAGMPAVHTALPQPPEGTPPKPPSPICPACGATAKPGARFCPRCGKPLGVETEPQPAASIQPPSASATTEPSMPVPQPYATPPHSPPPAQPAAYAQRASQPPPSPKPSAPKRGAPRSLWVAGSIAVFLCIAALVVGIVVLRPKLFGAEEEPTPTSVPTQTSTIEPTPTAAPPTQPPATETPTVAPTAEPAPGEAPVFGAQLTISSSATDLQVGQLVTITAETVNTGDVTFGNLRFQLLGNWEPHLSMITDEVVEHESDVIPGQSDASTFVLQATQPGTAVIRANVTVKTREDPPIVKPVPSDSELTISVTQ